MNEPALELVENKKCDAMVGAKRGAPAHQCPNDGRWYPVFVLRTKECKASVKAALAVKLCDSCRDAVKLTDLLTESGWQTIIQAFLAQGKKPPKHSLTQLDFVLIGSDEAHTLLHSIC